MTLADEAGGLDCNSNVELEELAQGDGAFEEESTVNEDETENLSLSRRKSGDSPVVTTSGESPVVTSGVKQEEWC